MEIFVNDLDRHCTSFIIDAFCSCYIVYISDSLAAAVHVAAVPAVPCPSRFALAVFQFSGSIPSLLGDKSVYLAVRIPRYHPSHFGSRKALILLIFFGTIFRRSPVSSWRIPPAADASLLRRSRRSICSDWRRSSRCFRTPRSVFAHPF